MICTCQATRCQRCASQLQRAELTAEVLRLHKVKLQKFTHGVVLSVESAHVAMQALFAIAQIFEVPTQVTQPQQPVREIDKVTAALARQQAWRSKVLEILRSRRGEAKPLRGICAPVLADLLKVDWDTQRSAYLLRKMETERTLVSEIDHSQLGGHRRFYYMRE